MATTTFNQAISTNYRVAPARTSVLKRFINWCERQEETRLLWVGIALAGHGCVLTPLTIMVVVLAGASLSLFMVAIAAMAMSLVTNLAAQPTKITIPVFI